jgi:polyferredoxin
MTRKKRPSAQKKWRYLRAARRISQMIFLLLFLWLIGATVSITGATFDGSADESVSYPVELFLNLDPYAGLLVLLTSGVVPGAMILGLIVLVSSFFFGRGFCSWVCPMGTLNHIVGEVKPSQKGARRIKANATRPYQKTKYVILIFFLGAALLGSAVGGLLDPLCIATRGIALTFVPIVEWGLAALLRGIQDSNVPLISSIAEGARYLAGSALLQGKNTLVEGGLLLSIVFFAVLVANRFIPRFWCRGLCPLGAMLGLTGRFGLLTLKKNESTCTDCRKCQLACQGAASPKPLTRWQRSECDLCMNCVAACPESGTLSFVLSGWKTDEAPWPDLKRRNLLAGAVAGAALVPTVRTGTLTSVEGRPNPARIRPPGAVDEKAFLNRCIRCGQCMKICPNNALHPALDEGGIEGLWTPILVPRVGYCEPTCTLCSQVCPTVAIVPLSSAEKTGQDGAKPVKIGTAFVNRGRCLPWAMNTPCIVCEEFCPLSPKAIELSEVTVTVDGEVRHLKRPVVRPDRCTGCGACEHICPVHDVAAIRVSSVGESRSVENTLLQQDDGTRAAGGDHSRNRY